jgi:hypothetical protein
MILLYTIPQNIRECSQLLLGFAGPLGGKLFLSEAGKCCFLLLRPFGSSLLNGLPPLVPRIYL